MLLTVFTPTRNRAYILQRLYKSLCDLNDTDFEWLIIDDASSDNTEEIVNSFQMEQKITVRYYKQQRHEGKHSAYNRGLVEAKGEFFFNIDSDDCIAPDCLNHLKTIAHSLRNNRLAGYIAMKSDRKGNLLGRPFNRNMHIASFDELRTGGYDGEYSIIFKTEIARAFPFPIIDGELFMPESVIYGRMNAHRFFVDNDVMTICEYLPDGLSANWNRLRHENPRGFMLCHKEQADRATTPLEIVKNLIGCNHYRHIAKSQGHSCQYDGKHAVLAFMLYPVSILLGIKDTRKAGRFL